MLASLTVVQRLLSAFGASAIILGVIASLAYFNVSRTLESDAWVKHSYQVRTKLGELLIDLLDAESGMRGYLISGDESFLGAYTTTSRSISGTVAVLRSMTADNPAQQQRIETLIPLLQKKLEQFASRIELRRSQGAEALQKLIGSDDSRQTTEQIRTTIRDADQHETGLLNRRSEEARNSAALTMTVILWGGLIGSLGVALMGWLTSRALSRQIGTAVGQVRSSSTELQAAANQQASSAKEQAIAMAEISTTITELLATSRQIAESAQRVADNAEQTAQAAQSGHGTVDQTQDSITGIRRQVDQIVAHMLELGRKSQEIGSVLDIVSELAEQTNILAINATIEAAGAGESGKRFAVVAEEIRKLADRVGGSTKEVRSLIDDVRSAVNTTVMATETGSKAVDAGSRQFSDVATAFRQISSLVGAATEAAREIELSTKQQSSAVEQVNVAISSVTQASIETETSAGQTLQTVSQMAMLSRDLMRIIQARQAA